MRIYNILKKIMLKDVKKADSILDKDKSPVIIGQIHTSKIKQKIKEKDRRQSM